MARDVKLHKKEDYYYAQIASEIRRVLHRHPNRVKLEQFLIKFDAPTGAKQGPISDEEIKKNTALSKAKWMGITAVGRAVKTRTPPPKHMQGKPNASV